MSPVVGRDVSQIPGAVESAARRLSHRLWGQSYRHGQGPMVYASPQPFIASLRQHANAWRALAEAADRVADWVQTQPFVTASSPGGAWRGLRGAPADRPAATEDER